MERKNNKMLYNIDSDIVRCLRLKLKKINDNFDENNYIFSYYLNVWDFN